MAENARDLLIVGLRNAYALEGQAIQSLERQSERLEHYPDLEAQCRKHLEESRQQQSLLEDCLKRLDTSPSSFKDTVMKMTGNLQAMGHAAAGDEVLKNAFALYAFEHFEIASYRSLIAMAEAANMPDIAGTCGDILKQEEAMASWLGDHLAPITKTYISLSQSAATAKR